VSKSLSLDGERRLDITGASEHGSSPSIALSPDGRTIAYARAPRDRGAAELWIADANGRNARRLLAPEPMESFTNDVGDPVGLGLAWSPRGDTVAIDVVSTATCGPGHNVKCASWYARLVPLDGGPSRVVGGLNVDWAPTGERILVTAGLFSLEDENDWALAVENLDGSPGWQTDSRSTSCAPTAPVSERSSAAREGAGRPIPTGRRTAALSQ
jgi:hypothetical protein